MRSKQSFFSAIATSIMILAIAPPILARPNYSPYYSPWKISQQDINLLPQTAALIYVAPRINANVSPNILVPNTVVPNTVVKSADGSPNNPYPSITAALATKPVSGTVVQLAEGIYSAETGELFPIKLPSGVTLRGEPTVKGANTFINGGGRFISPTFASQNITILADDAVRIEGITLTNPNTRGTAIWVESSKQVAIANNTFSNSDREGVFLTGTADAIVSENLFKKNGANGLSAVGSSIGEIRDNTFEATGFGLAIGQKSRVNVSNNNILNNTDGIVISNLSAPTLRNNLIVDNKRNGIVILKDRRGYPTPDLGTSISLGKNIFRNNLYKDLNNNSGVTQVAVGNELDPQKVVGVIAFTGATPPSSQVVANSPVERSPQPSFNRPTTSPTALPPSSIFIEPLPEVPSQMTSPKTATPSISSPRISEDILIDRDPIPVTPPQPINPSRSQFIPNRTDRANSNPLIPISPTVITNSIQPLAIPYNYRIAALVPTAAIDTFPYLVVVPSSDSESLNRVRSVVPTAKIIPSRFGNIIMVQGYPDRDRAEVLKTIMRSEIGLDARVFHQNSL